MCQPPAVDTKMKGSTSLLCRKRTEKKGSERQLCSSGSGRCWGLQGKSAWGTKEGQRLSHESSAWYLMHKWSFESNLVNNHDLKQLKICAHRSVT